MDISVRVISHAAQRYDTVGDWWFRTNADGCEVLEIRVSSMGDTRYENLVATHEIHEAVLCRARGITELSVSKFDKNFESKRLSGDISEPGDDKRAPYRKEHFFATTVERLLAAELNVDWMDYDEAVMSL
jgi:hypothetical protein